MTVLDTSAAVDYLLGDGVADAVRELLRSEGELAAPDVLTFEVLAVLRRGLLAGRLGERRAVGAVDDYGDLAVRLFPALPLRHRAFELRDRLTAADSLFVALAERLEEPLISKDAGLLRTAEQMGVRTVKLD